MTNPIVTIENDHVYTTSLLVAEKFEKRHKNVLRDIEAIIKKCPIPDFVGLNFEPNKYLVNAGKNWAREEKFYKLTRKGFSLLVRSFTGEKAFLWNLAYIEAFDKMEAKLTALGQVEHHAMLDSLYGRHPQWQQTVDLTRQGLRTGQVAELQRKAPSSVRAMKARIRKAGIDLTPIAHIA